VQEKMMPKCKLFKITPLHVQKLNYREGVYELGDHFGDEALSLGLLLKFKSVKKTHATSFPNAYKKVMLKSNPCFFMCYYLTMKRQNKDTIGVTIIANAKLAHHKGLVLGYPMENEISFAHHGIKQ